MHAAKPSYFQALLPSLLLSLADLTIPISEVQPMALKIHFIARLLDILLCLACMAKVLTMYMAAVLVQVHTE